MKAHLLAEKTKFSNSAWQLSFCQSQYYVFRQPPAAAPYQKVAFRRTGRRSCTASIPSCLTDIYHTTALTSPPSHKFVIRLLLIIYSDHLAQHSGYCIIDPAISQLAISVPQRNAMPQQHSFFPELSVNAFSCKNLLSLSQKRFWGCP